MMKYMLNKKNTFALIFLVRRTFSSQIFTDLLETNSNSSLNVDFDRNKKYEYPGLENNHCMFPSFPKDNNFSVSFASQSTQYACNLTFEERYNPQVSNVKSCMYSDYTYYNNSEMPRNNNCDNNQTYPGSIDSHNSLLRYEEYPNCGFEPAHYTNIAPKVISKPPENSGQILSQTFPPTVTYQHNICTIDLQETHDISFENKNSDKYFNQEMIPYQKSMEPTYNDLSLIHSVNNQNTFASCTSVKKTDSRKRKHKNITLNPSNAKKLNNGLDLGRDNYSQLDSLTSTIPFTYYGNGINKETSEIKPTYYERSKKILKRFMNKKNKLYCENYEFFFNFVPFLFLEIEEVKQENISSNEIYYHPILTHLSADSWNKYIDDEIENYNSIIIDSEIEFRKILDFTEGLIFYEKYFPSHLGQTQLICLAQKMTYIFSKMKDECSFGLFYELIKFAEYYEDNLCDYIEQNHNLYVYFILSIISKQLKNINVNLILDSKIYSRRKYFSGWFFTSAHKQECVKMLYIQRLFSKLLFAMKNGKLRMKFYNIFIILDITWQKHYKKDFLNQTTYFRFYLRVFISFILDPEFNSNADNLDRFCCLSLNILKLKRDLSDRFLRELEFIRSNFSLGVFTLSINLKILRNSWILDKNKEKLADKLTFAYDKLNFLSTLSSIPYKYFSINNIFLSEICLSGCLSNIYGSVRFDEEITCYELEVIYEKKLRL